MQAHENALFVLVRDWSPKDELARIEHDAAERYRDAGYEPAVWPEHLATHFGDYAAKGLLWVAVMRGRAVGFAVVDRYGDTDHLEELDVLRAHQGRGIGAALVHAVIENARLCAQSAVTLRTFTTTPWSVGLYEKMGFRRWDPNPIPKWLATILEHEHEMDLKPEERLSMRCPLGGS